MNVRCANAQPFICYKMGPLQVILDKFRQTWRPMSTSRVREMRKFLQLTKRLRIAHPMHVIKKLLTLLVHAVRVPTRLKHRSAWLVPVCFYNLTWPA